MSEEFTVILFISFYKAKLLSARGKKVFCLSKALLIIWELKHLLMININLISLQKLLVIVGYLKFQEMNIKEQWRM